MVSPLPGPARPLEPRDRHESPGFVPRPLLALLDLPVFRRDDIGIALVADELDPGNVARVAEETGDFPVQHQLAAVGVRPAQPVRFRFLAGDSRVAHRTEP